MACFRPVWASEMTSYTPPSPRALRERPRFSRQPISTLAFEAGFNDLSRCNRAFKAKSGLSPRQVRAAGRHTPS
jgi:AraC-like DNA-binding protein